jgi:hypothetical protein
MYDEFNATRNMSMRIKVVRLGLMMILRLGHFGSERKLLKKVENFTSGHIGCFLKEKKRERDEKKILRSSLCIDV